MELATPFKVLHEVWHSCPLQIHTPHKEAIHGIIAYVVQQSESPTLESADRETFVTAQPYLKFRMRLPFTFQQKNKALSCLL
ncbi:hypothetical protein CHS0354_036323 [Potamilus streckersoni]|uniref:Uncharacterized protein n=1 Tax=Potamilus streckersoni TaxID=2493646 RepID=A0AAE0VGQ0_9BIVA|nr:hypothetical protein CHS0354_036323 [Potamilus streckersoni]